MAAAVNLAAPVTEVSVTTCGSKRPPSQCQLPAVASSSYSSFLPFGCCVVIGKMANWTPAAVRPVTHWPMIAETFKFKASGTENLSNRPVFSTSSRIISCIIRFDRAKTDSRCFHNSTDSFSSNSTAIKCFNSSIISSTCLRCTKWLHPNVCGIWRKIPPCYITSNIWKHKKKETRVNYYINNFINMPSFHILWIPFLFCICV